jgi:ABC-type bacteriocin/lantibiotic exporter with double-glycine peptidase domain
MSIAGLHFVHASRHGPARPTLDDVDLRLQRGRRIALVGASGSGKSALLRVLAGLYAAGSADVRIDGSPADMARVAALATLIPQDAEVFEGTLRENLEMAGCTDDVQLLSAMHVVCMDDWLASLAGGLDTVLTERGGNLSGGQRQRIALARGLIAARGSSLLLLDEATSNLDPATEGRLLDRLTQDRHDACIVASVHRPALLARFDEVIRLEAGRVVERIVNAPAAG